jgi:murein DD-endopeptidase MepM/ murein hydrolase activator NlpD
LDNVCAVSKLVEIKSCDLYASSKINYGRYVRKDHDELAAEIERYNNYVIEFASASGERLTHISVLVPDKIAAKEGMPIVPELYYNEKGNSLEGAFLKAPLDYYRITSRFTGSRYHPVLKRYRAHHGVDYAAPTGTPVYAIGSGKVIDKGYQANGGGNYVKIRHNSTYTTTYMHLSRFAKGLKVGDHVAQKEVIGYVGSTGLSTGPHLDFRVYENGKPVNPLTIKSQPKKPISDENHTAFRVVCDSLVRRLGAL